MKRNLDLPILQLDGKPFEDKATLKTVAFLAVTATLQSDQSMQVNEKMRLYALAQKVHAGGVVDLEAEDVALLKDRIGKAFSHVVVIGRAFELLENEVQSMSLAAFDAAVDARDMPSGTTKQPDQYAGS